MSGPVWAKENFVAELRSLTPIQRTSLDMFGDPDYWPADRPLTGEYWSMWGHKMPIKELARYYGHKE